MSKTKDKSKKIGQTRDKPSQKRYTGSRRWLKKKAWNIARHAKEHAKDQLETWMSKANQKDNSLQIAMRDYSKKALKRLEDKKLHKMIKYG